MYTTQIEGNKGGGGHNYRKTQKKKAKKKKQKKNTHTLTHNTHIKHRTGDIKTKMRGNTQQNTLQDNKYRHRKRTPTQGTHTPNTTRRDTKKTKCGTTHSTMLCGTTKPNTTRQNTKKNARQHTTRTTKNTAGQRTKTKKKTDDLTPSTRYHHASKSSSSTHLEQKVFVLVLADVLEGDITASPLRSHRHADPHVVQHRLLHGRALFKRRREERRSEGEEGRKRQKERILVTLFFCKN